MLLAVSLLWVLVLLSFLIIIHEIGHFLAAKWAGVHVEEFGLGYPPRAATLFTRWKTRFTLNVIPLGGFVRLYGDDSESVERIEPESRTQAVSESQAYRNKSVWQRFVILMAGVTINFLFGVIAFAVVYSSVGIPQVTPYNAIVVEAVNEGSPASQVGLAPETRITAVQLPGASEPTSVTTTSEFTDLIVQARGQEVQLTVDHADRDDEVVTVRVRIVDETPEGEGSLGISIADSDVELTFYPWWQMPWRGMLVGLEQSFELSRQILVSLAEMVRDGLTRGQLPTDLSGPVGIVDQTVDSGVLTSGWVGRFNWMAILSVNLAVMNLLPIPMLDGGRIVFLLLEPLIGAERRRRYEQQALGFGLAFLVLLIVVITWKDIAQLRQ